MPTPTASPSARETELLERAYAWVLEHGLSDLSLRPLAAAIGSSPRVLLFLFGSNEGLLRVWVEAYGRSLTDPTGPWGEFARATVDDWLAVLAAAQPAEVRRTARGRDQRTTALALLRGGLLDLLATGDRRRVDAAVRAGVATLELPG